MTADPYQLQNQAGQAAYAKVQKQCAETLAALQGCAGANCAWTGHFPKPPQ
jgi:hypothetical protein